MYSREKSSTEKEGIKAGIGGKLRPPQSPTDGEAPFAGILSSRENHAMVSIQVHDVAFQHPVTTPALVGEERDFYKGHILSLCLCNCCQHITMQISNIGWYGCFALIQD